MALKLKGANAPTFDILTFITSLGDKVDILPQLETLVIFEDIFSPVLTGNITITDTLGLFDKLPIIGQEQLTVKFRSYNYSDDNAKINFLHRTFDILKVSNVTVPTDASKRYILHFASPELKKNETIKISRAFQSTTLSNIVATLMTGDYNNVDPVGLGFSTENEVDTRDSLRSKFLTPAYTEVEYQKVDDNDSMELFVEKTKYTEPWITFPYIKPFDAIRWLASRSIRDCGGRFGGKDGEQTGFLFFENKRGFQFTALESLTENYDMNTSVFAFGAARQNQLSGINVIEVPDSIERLEIEDCYDTINNIKNGLYASKLQTYDMATGELRDNDFNYLKNFERVQAAQNSVLEYPALSLDSADITGSPAAILSSQYLSKRLLVPFNPTRGRDNITSDTTQRNNDVTPQVGPEEYLQTRMSYMAALNNYRVLLEIPGNSKHKAGDSVELDLKDHQWNAGLTKFTETSSTFYSGRYLITSIKHQLTKFDYTMVVEAAKTSYKSRIGK